MSGPARVSSQQVTLGGKVREMRTSSRVAPTVRPTAHAVQDPAVLTRMLSQMQSDLSRATEVPLSLPFLGGRVLTSYAFAATTAVLVAHGLGKAAVAYFPMKMRAVAAATIFEPVWQNGIAYSLHDFRLPTKENGFFYETTTAGNSGAIEPSWPTTEGATIVDNTNTWTCRRYNRKLAILLMASAACTVDLYIA